MKIGELSKKVGCSIQAIRYYEKEGILNCTVRSEGNFRLYDETAVRELSFILRCRTLDISLAEIKKLNDLKYRPDENCQNVNKLFDQHIKDVDIKMKELSELKKQLESLRERCTDKKHVDECGIIQELSK